MLPRLFVTGASGRLGGRLASLLADRFDVVAARHVSPIPEGLEACALDLADPVALEGALSASRAEAVLHAGAMADPDACQRRPEAAHRVNVEATRALATLCVEQGIPLLALSSDLVVGTPAPLADERAPVAATSAYAGSKLAAEQAVLATPVGVVLRVALVVGRGHGARPTASEAVLWALRRGERPRLFDDQFRSPIDAESLAELAWLAITRRSRGLFHAGGGERLSRYALGLRVARLFDLPGDAIESVGRAVQAGPMRPADASLDSGRARRELGWRPRPLDAALAESREPPATSPAA